MNYRILYAESALKQLRKIDRSVAQRIIRAIDGLSSEPRPVGSIKLVGGSGELRIRVGNYRVVYEINDDEVVVLVLRVAHRREVYR